MRIGIDIGGTTVSCAIVDSEGRIVTQNSISTDKDRPSGEVIKDIADAALALTGADTCSLESITSVGVGCPGILDKAAGRVVYSNNIAWQDVPLVEQLQQYIPKKIVIDNDANCAALGEFICGAARGSSSSVMVTLGTGVGGGIILNNRLHSGFNGAANVVGHMVLVSGGEPCTCGRKGCWEAYASVTALVRMARQAAAENPASQLAKLEDGEGFNGKTIFAAAKAGDETALQLLDKYFFYVAEGIIDLVNVLQPEVVVIGGGLSHEGDYLLNPVKQYVAEGVYCKQVALPKIKVAELNNSAGVIGAAYLSRYRGQ